MKFTLSHPDLHITAENGTEIAELCKHFRRPIESHIDELVAGRMEYIAEGDKRPWFELGAMVPITVPFDFLKPYYDRLKVVTGYDGPAFIIDDPRLRCSRRLQNLCHTHLVVDAFIDEFGYHAHGFIQSQDWDGRTAAERAPRQFNEYLRSHLGTTKSEPEYIGIAANGGGLLRHNPNYGKYHAPQPGLASSAVFEVLFCHWLDNCASLAQQVFYLKAAACYGTVVKSDSLAANLMNIVNEFHVDNYKRVVTFDEFKEMA